MLILLGEQSAFRFLPIPVWAGKGSGLEGALCSTADRGLPLSVVNRSPAIAIFVGLPVN